MSEPVEVLRESVLETLRGNGVTVTESKALDNQVTDNKAYILEKDGILEEQTFPPRLGRRHLHYLQRHFGVAIHLFFNAPSGKPGPVPLAKKSSKSA